MAIRVDDNNEVHIDVEEYDGLAKKITSLEEDIAWLKTRVH